MRRANKSWMAAITATLMLGIVVGVVWARPNDGPQAADITRKVTLTGGDFIPANAEDWDTYADYVTCLSDICFFTAPVVFPCLPSVTVERIKLHAIDDNVVKWAYADLWRMNPATGAKYYLGGTGSPVGTSEGLQTYTSSAINKKVWPSQKACISLAIYGTDVKVYGVTVEYHRNI